MTGKSLHKIATKIEKLKEDLKSLANNPSTDSKEESWVNEALIASELAHLEKIIARNQKDHMKALLTNHGEQLGGPWSAISKENKPRDLILQLKVPNTNPPRFERCTKCMTNLARNYHENLQHKGLGIPKNHPDYRLKVKAILDEIPPNQHLSEGANHTFQWKVEPDHLREALSLAKNGSAMGIDGLPYELWRELSNRNENAKKQESEGFDIADTLTLIFQDIQEHRVDRKSDFTLGWMCPIYKKKTKGRSAIIDPLPSSTQTLSYSPKFSQSS